MAWGIDACFSKGKWHAASVKTLCQWLLVCASFLPAMAADTADAQIRRLAITLSTSEAVQFEKLEFTFPIAAVAENPYNPAEVDFRVELTSPSGKSIGIPAFYYQPFEPLDNHPNGFCPAGPPVWKARFAPREIGSYQGVAVMRDRAGLARSQGFRFETKAGVQKGFLRVSAMDRRYLEFEDATPFFAIGQNVAFIKNVTEQAEMIRQLGAHGGNFARVWACAEDWGLAIEARKSAWGRSWDWKPPFTVMPDGDANQTNQLCMKISGEAGAGITMNPCAPVGLRAQTAYTFSGALRSTENTGVTFVLGGTQTFTAQPQWTPFKLVFTNQNTTVLPKLDVRLTAKGNAWLRDLSLKEAGGGPELLEEADPNRPALGVYNQRDCHELDCILETAEQSGVYLQIVLLTRNLYMSQLSQSSSQAYAAATDYAKRMTRYAAARWGYSTHIVAWEYFNEMDPGMPTEAFYTDLARHLDTVDVNRHLRVTSTWHSPSKDYAHPDLDLANQHHYLRPPSGEIWKDEVASILAQWKLNQARLQNKPLFFAEFGITDANWQRAPQLTNDKEFVHLHNALWLTTALGYGSTTCHWYWDDIHRRNLYPLYQPLARFVADIPFNSGKLTPTKATCSHGVRVFGQQSDAFTYLWLWNPQTTWWKIAMDQQEPAAITGAKISVPGLKPGNYTVQWWDTRKGEVLANIPAKPQNGNLLLEPPAFARDLAVKVQAAPH
jgi:hypothetical protein